nr:unnamed protein product [Spirometra erinaceieuropaei]
MMGLNRNPKRQAIEALVPAIVSLSSRLPPGTRIFASIGNVVGRGALQSAGRWETFTLREASAYAQIRFLHRYPMSPGGALPGRGAPDLAACAAALSFTRAGAPAPSAAVMAAAAAAAAAAATGHPQPLLPATHHHHHHHHGSLGGLGSVHSPHCGVASLMRHAPSPPNSWCLFVYNLAPETEEATLWRLFGPFGAVRSVTVVREHASSRCRGFGFVKMKNYEDALMAIQHLNG